MDRKEEFLNKMLVHLSTMESQCFSDAMDSCAYRDGSGSACLVGALIPDDKYVVDMDETGEMAAPGLGVRKNTLVQAALGLDPEADEDTIEFLARCQAKHDAVSTLLIGAKFRGCVARGLKRVANTFGVPFNPPESLAKEMKEVSDG